MTGCNQTEVTNRMSDNDEEKPAFPAVKSFTRLSPVCQCPMCLYVEMHHPLTHYPIRYAQQFGTGQLNWRPYMQTVPNPAANLNRFDAESSVVTNPNTYSK